MRIRKLIIFWLLLLFSQFSYSADIYVYNNGNQAVTDCRSAIDSTNHYYCVVDTGFSYFSDSANHLYVLGYVYLKDSSSNTINTYHYGTDINNVNNINSCASVPDLGVYSSYSHPRCSNGPALAALRICPAATSWTFNTSLNQCVYGGNDSDNDGVLNDGDNCPDVANSDQADTDSDGIGDACEAAPSSDVDNDGVPDTSDNCPNDANADQANADGDLFGDVCDTTPNGPDGDSDGFPDSSDNCPVDPNPSQADADSDGIGDACDTCNAGDYTNHQEFPSDTVSSSIPASYCNSNNCTMNKSGQNCSAGVCYVDYSSSGVSCSPDSTPSDWSQYFTTAPDTSGFNLAADNAAFILNNGLSALTGLNNNYKFIVTNCVRSSNTDISGLNFNINTIGCPNFTYLNICSTTAQIDSYLQQYLVDNPFQTTTYESSVSSLYYKPVLTSVFGDGLFGTDGGDGTYTVSLAIQDYVIKELTKNQPITYSESAMHQNLIPIKLALTGCTSNATGGTGGTGGTGSSGTYEFNSGGSASGFGTEATDALVTAKTELTDTLNTIKSEFNTYIYGTCGTDVNGDPILDELGNPINCSFGLNVGTAELPTFEIGTVKGVDVTVDWTKWSDPLLSVGNAIIVLAALLAFSIIF